MNYTYVFHYFVKLIYQICNIMETIQLFAVFESFVFGSRINKYNNTNEAVTAALEYWILP